MNDLINSTEVANLEAQQTGATEQTQQATEPIQTPAPEETLYEVKVNGQTIKVPITELTGGYSRQQDYTRKTAELAEQRRQIETEVNTYREQLSQVQQFFSDPRVQQALAGLRAGVEDPNQPLNAAQVQQLFESQAAHQQQQQEARIQAMAQDLEVRTLAANYNRDITNTITQLKQQHPVLDDIEDIDVLLRRKVAERITPESTLEDAKKLFVDLASGMAQKLENRFKTQQKQAAVQQANLVKNGIEPPGGVGAVTPQGGKPAKLGSNDLLAQAVADMVAASNK